MSQLNPLSNTLVRRAVVDEAAIIARVLYQAFVEFEAQYTPAAFAATTPTSDQIQKRWSDGPVWVAAQGDQLVGTISAVPKARACIFVAWPFSRRIVVKGLGIFFFGQLSSSPLHRNLNIFFSAQHLFYNKPFDYMSNSVFTGPMTLHTSCSELH